ncbi:hypothetical protein B0H14DRAFT_3661971 [Mycena olivaceomarginata]|nr:hypothetical protein B0H14DRAFT_3661971 [Mycena olivaceomarginata]
MSSSHILALEECSSTSIMVQTLEIGRHVRFVNGAHEEGRLSMHLRQKSPPPPYESVEDCLEELLLDLAFAEESIWILESALDEATNPRTSTPPPPPYSSLEGWTSWTETISVIELQMDLLIAQQRIPQAILIISVLLYAIVQKSFQVSIENNRLVFGEDIAYDTSALDDCLNGSVVSHRYFLQQDSDLDLVPHISSRIRVRGHGRVTDKLIFLVFSKILLVVRECSEKQLNVNEMALPPRPSSTPYATSTELASNASKSKRRSGKRLTKWSMYPMGPDLPSAPRYTTPEWLPMPLEPKQVWKKLPLLWKKNSLMTQVRRTEVASG